MIRTSLLSSLLWFSCALLPGCPGTTTSDTGGDMDAPPGLDTPSGSDVPSGTDTPRLDTPSGSDVPSGTDTPVAMTDAPVAMTDAPTACADLPAAACIQAGCIPGFDDSCCPVCPPGGPCADCVNPDYHGCQAREDSACASGCGTAPDWVCNGSPPNCAAASVVDVDSCSIPGCVPAFPSGMGDPDLLVAECTPIVATSCTVMCRRVAPPCPTGTFPEGNGSCYTDRCLPDFVCR